MITTKNNEEIKRINTLKETNYRAVYGEYIAEGIKPVREAISSGAEVVKIIRDPDCKAENFCAEKTLEVSREVFQKLSEEISPQGILAVLKIPSETKKVADGRCLLLDGISDPGNLGTIIRTANAAGYTDIWLRNCADPYSPKCVRASMSGIFFVRLFSVEGDVSEIFSGIPLICADMNGENVFKFSAPDKFCLVIGNEANGVTQEIREMCRYTVKIPMRASCESLNAAVSAGILMYLLADFNA